jgi:CRP/FNR family transcriptional regulator
MIKASVEIVLRKTPLFASLTEEELRALAARITRKSFPAGAMLFAEGDSCTGLFLVASGKIRIFKLSPGGREQVLAVEGPGSSFAELPVFDGGNYPATAAALEDAEVIFISRKDFQNFCREHPEVALKVIAVVGTRLRRLVGPAGAFAQIDEADGARMLRRHLPEQGRLLRAAERDRRA